MVARFREQAEWCSLLETSGLKVCDLVLGPTDGQVHLIARLEEAAKGLRVMQDEHEEALQSSATLVRAQCWEGLMRRLPWWWHFPHP
jgi:hypothetical protein